MLLLGVRVSVFGYEENFFYRFIVSFCIFRMISSKLLIFQVFLIYFIYVRVNVFFKRKIDKKS